MDKSIYLQYSHHAIISMCVHTLQASVSVSYTNHAQFDQRIERIASFQSYSFQMTVALMITNPKRKSGSQLGPNWHALRRRQRAQQRVVVRGAYGHWHFTHFAHYLLQELAGFYVYLYRFRY